MKRNYSHFELGNSRSAHTARQNRWMQHYHGGAYAIDKTEPETMDLPEICSFRIGDGLLDNLGFCNGEIIVVVDKEFGIIPVCKFHADYCIRPWDSVGVDYVPQQYLTRP